MNYQFLFCSLLLLMACNTEKPAGQTTNMDMDTLSLEDKARQLARNTIITDGHVDLPYRLNKEMEDVSGRTEKGDFDFVRARSGGLDAPFMSIYVPSSYQESEGAHEFADQMIDLVVRITTEYPDKFAIARNPREVEELFQKGLVALPMGMENGAPLEDDLRNVKYFYDKGIRYITLTHAKDNLICDSSYDTTRTWNGLSEYGRKVVAEMNRVGIMVDVSHISDDAFYQVMEISQAPVIASHSSCRYFTPGWQRNMSDDMIKTLADHGGVIQMNFGSNFLDGASRASSNEIDKYLTAWETESELGAEEIEAFKQSYRSENYRYSNVSKVVDHIDHVVSLAGIDHVAFGSDFDGVGNTLPTGLKDVSHYPNIIAELLRRGYSEEDIAKICHKNVFRVWDKAAQVALEQQKTS